MKKDHQNALRLFRIANLIRDQLAAQATRRLTVAVSDERSVAHNMTRYLDLCRRVGKAHSHQWLGAAANLLTQANTVLEDLHCQIEGCWRQRHDASQPICTLSDIVRDLRQIEDEFHSWQFDEEDEAQTLSVQTEPITLEGVALGPFEIQLQLRESSRSDVSSAFKVIALEPNGAGGRDVVTHPHVSDERLCAGDATVPMRAALDTGRICDFFTLARAVLQTYNPNSAYVQLDQWGGEPCHDCGHLIDDEEGFFCESCEHNFCDSCTSYCRQCDTSACLGCLETCPHCEDRTCASCMKTCPQCNQSCCSGCLIDELCPECHELNKENNHDADEHQDGTVAPAVAVPGQTACAAA